jgi:hypothetical protein
MNVPAWNRLCEIEPAGDLLQDRHEFGITKDFP